MVLRRKGRTIDCSCSTLWPVCLERNPLNSVSKVLKEDQSVSLFLGTMSPDDSSVFVLLSQDVDWEGRFSVLLEAGGARLAAEEAQLLSDSGPLLIFNEVVGCFGFILEK